MQPADVQPEKKKKSSLGFIALIVIGGSLLVVCIIGILAAIAIPAFVGYIRRSKTAEARMNLMAIARSEESYCQDRNALVTSAGPVPAIPGANKQLASFTDDPGFAAIQFSQSDYVYFSYSIRPDPAVPGGARLRAEGDLDGDGTRSTFEIACRADCSCDPEPTVTDETE